MKRIATISMTALTLLTLTACGSGNSSDNNKDNNQKTEQKASSNKESTQEVKADDKPQTVLKTKKGDKNGVTLDKYQKITVGGNQVGDTPSEVEKELGKPNMTNKTDASGQQVTTYSWTKISPLFAAKQVSVQFMNGFATTKTYTSAPNDLKPINEKKVNEIQTGANYQDVVSKLGTPAAEGLSGNSLMNSRNVTYVTSSTGSAYSFVFVNGSLQSKSETHLQ